MEEVKRGQKDPRTPGSWSRSKPDPGNMRPMGYLTTGIHTPYGDAFRLAVLAVQTPLPSLQEKKRATPPDRLVGETICAAIAAATPPDLSEMERRRWNEVSRSVMAPAVERAHARYRVRAEELHGCARLSAIAGLTTLAVGVCLPVHGMLLVACLLGLVSILAARAPADLLRVDLQRIERAADQLGTELLIEEERRALPPSTS